MASRSAFPSAFLTALAVGAAIFRAPEPSLAVEAESRAPVKAICLPSGETREEIKQRHLLEPFAVLKAAAAQHKAEALSVKLCHIGDEFVYEISLLHRDGRFVRLIVNAASGKASPPRGAREATPKI
jgi:hypothetical protein